MWKFSFLSKSESGDRQPRFEVVAPINFRRRGEFSWNMGKTNNMSRSGVLFRAVQVLKPDTKLEFEFVAPKEFGEEAGELLSCSARVVRAALPPPNDRRGSMAAKFSKIQVLRRPGEW
jgi:hypothetical protein